MKKCWTKIICVLLALSALCMTACGEAKPTAEYLEFYGMANGATFEARNVPDGYEIQWLYVNRYENHVEFKFNFTDWTLCVMLDKNPEKPIIAWYRHYVRRENPIEKIACLSYSSSTEFTKVDYVYVNSENLAPTHADYDAIVTTVKCAYEDLLPVVNDIISQISGGKYSSLDDFRKIAE